MANNTPTVEDMLSHAIFDIAPGCWLRERWRRIRKEKVGRHRPVGEMRKGPLCFILRIVDCRRPPTRWLCKHFVTSVANNRGPLAPHRNAGSLSALLGYHCAAQQLQGCYTQIPRRRPSCPCLVFIQICCGCVVSFECAARDLVILRPQVSCRLYREITT